jgi:hypothetical protein
MQRQRQLQPQALSTPRSVVSGIHRIHRFSHSVIMRLVFGMTKLPELYMWNRRPFMSSSHLERVRCAMRQIAKVLAKASHWSIIEMYWNTPLQQNNIWSIAFEAHTQDIMKEVW